MTCCMIERPDRPTAFTGILILLIILLTFVLFLMVISGTPGVREKWQFVSNDSFTYMAVDESDTLYAFLNNTVVAIDKHGDRLWNLTFPDDSRICGDLYLPGYLNLDNGSLYISSSTVDPVPVFSTNDGMLYLYVQSDNPSCSMAIR